MNDLDRDTVILTLVAYAEARSEGRDGIRGQVHSVVNRHNAGKWYSRKTIAGCCMLAYAYSAENTSDPNREIAAECPQTDPIMMMCADEAAAAIDGRSLDPTGGATHYYREGTPEPDWVSGIDKKSGERKAPPATFTVKINHHLFYKDVA